MSAKREAGDSVRARGLATISGTRVELPVPGRLTHLQFRRFAGCPVCNLHLRSFVQRVDEIDGAGVTEIVVFHSTVAELKKYESDLPFAVIADPDKRLYREFGVESAVRALLSPKAWWPLLRAVVLSALRLMRGGGPVPPLFPGGGRYGLPADLLIAPDGRVLAAHYGDHVNDQWSVDEMLALAAARVPSRRVSTVEGEG